MNGPRWPLRVQRIPINPQSSATQGQPGGGGLAKKLPNPWYKFICVLHVKIFFSGNQDQEECHIPTFELMLTFDFSEQNAHTIWQEYGDRDRYVNWILQTQKVQIFMSAGCVQNQRIHIEY